MMPPLNKFKRLDLRKNHAGVVNEAMVARLAEAALRVLNEPPENSTS